VRAEETADVPCASGKDERPGATLPRRPDSRHRIEISMGESVQASAQHVITCQGLGSCVAVALYDWRHKTGALAHVMLPYAAEVEGAMSGKCADQATHTMVEGLLARGACRQDLVARIAGGARMFAPHSDDGPGIGERNVRSVKDALRVEEVPLLAEDTGGSRGRTVQFHLASGQLLVSLTERRGRPTERRARG
jgi:chemotaxis protein CheD